VYGAVPLLADAEADPSLSPQVVSVEDVDALGDVESSTVTDAELVHPLASVIVTV